MTWERWEPVETVVAVLKDVGFNQELRLSPNSPYRMVWSANPLETVTLHLDDEHGVFLPFILLELHEIDSELVGAFIQRLSSQLS